MGQCRNAPSSSGGGCPEYEDKHCNIQVTTLLIYLMENQRFKPIFLYNSFFLTPLNYFDSDISIDSKNAILLSAPELPGNVFTHDDYGVQPMTCIPDAPEPFTYVGVEMHDPDGDLSPPKSLQETRRIAELYHRIQL